MFKTIIVDDIPEYVESIKIEMPEEFELYEAYSLNEAKEKFQKIKFDLAIIDVRLKEEDEENKEGIDLLEWIKRNFPQTKVIMISAYREFEFKALSILKGADCFLEKPINPELLREEINKLFKK